MASKHIRALGRGCIIAGIAVIPFFTIFVLYTGGIFLDESGSKVIMGISAVIASVGCLLVGIARKMDGRKYTMWFVVSGLLLLAYLAHFFF